MALTYFVAALTCPECGVVTPEDSSTGMRNHLGSGHGVQVLRVGDGGITLPNIASEYIQVRDPGDGQEVRLLETWTCAACSSDNWAVVTIRDGTIESIEARPVSRATLDDVHFVTENVAHQFEALTGESLWDDRGVRPDFAELLRPVLPA
jgi:hypothetical protein